MPMSGGCKAHERHADGRAFFVEFVVLVGATLHLQHGHELVVVVVDCPEAMAPVEGKSDA